MLAMRLGGDRVGGLDAAACRARAQVDLQALALAWDLRQLAAVERAA